MLRSTIYGLLLIVGSPEAFSLRSRNKASEHGKLAQNQQNGQADTSSELDADRAVSRERAEGSLADVIEMITQMHKDLLEQHEEDRQNHKDYIKWCDDSEQEKNDFIMEQKALVMATRALQASNEQRVQKLGEEVTAFDNDISDARTLVAKLVKMRGEEHAQFQTSIAQVTKTLAALLKATEIIEGHAAVSAAELAEVRSHVQLALTVYGIHSPMATEGNVQKLTALLQTGRPATSFLNTDSSAGEDDAIRDSSAGGQDIITMLTDFHSQIESQKQDLIAKESENQRQYETTHDAKQADLNRMEHIQKEKIAQKQHCEAAIEGAIATLQQTQQQIAEAQGTLQQLAVDRDEYEKGFKERTALRKNEMSATQAALDALQAVAADTKGVTPGSAVLLQTRVRTKTGSKLKLAETEKSNSQAYSQASGQLQRLTELTRGINNQELQLLVSGIKQDYFDATQQKFFDDSKFAPVLKLINDLIKQLEEEQNAETSQHEWCNTEKEGGVASQQEREKNTDGLKQTIEAHTTTIAQLKTEILFLQSEIARVEEETRVAQGIRDSEHAVFMAAKKDHEEVILAINTALDSIGQYGASGAMGMLQDLLMKYSTSLSEITAQEKELQHAHDQLLKKNAQFVAETTATANNRMSERRMQIGELGDDKSEMKTNLIELHEVSKYLQDLRASCDDIRSTYEERKERREAEITALKEALEVISDPDAMSA